MAKASEKVASMASMIGDFSSNSTWLELESNLIAGFLALYSELLVRNTSVCPANVEVVP